MGLERARWCAHLDLMSRECSGLEAALSRGRALPAAPPRDAVRLPLRSIRFDDDADLLTMELAGVAERAPELRLYIAHPRRIRATESAEGRSLLVTEQSGVKVQVLVARRVRGDRPPIEHHERSDLGRAGGTRSPAR
jgi:hypothetical protein